MTPAQRRTEWLVEEAEHLSWFGVDLDQIARRLGYASRSSLDRVLTRAGHPTSHTIATHRKETAA